MARPRRLRFPGVSQHVVQRGNNRIDIFHDDSDREVLIALLADAISRHALDINGYVLMRNHFHLVATPRHATALEKVMHRVECRYVRHFNSRYSRTGALFDGRYRPAVVDTDVYWYSCLRYVELNPVRAGVLKTPDACRWSSYGAHAFGAADPLVTYHQLYLSLGATPEIRQRHWRTMCGRGLTIEELAEIRAAVHRGGVLGRLVVPDDDKASPPPGNQEI